MATIDIIRTRDFTEQCYLHSDCSSKYSLNESKTIREVRIRSLSHWSHFTPNSESMASAGWFSCNVNDRVI
ncbi:unnamed protein product, partial [Rotaria sp. Silwood1]